MADLKATVLVDNTAGCGLSGEWGLSAFIEYRGKKILLDTGASERFAKNAAALGFRLEEVDYAVLSHAHYDHSNGMERFFKENASAKFYLQECCGEDCYKKILFFPKYIGLPKGVLKKYADRVERVSEDREISEGIHLISHKKPGRDLIGKRENMIRRTENGWVTDDFSHEQSLVFETENGLVIFNSCSHGGASDIVTEVLETLGGRENGGENTGEKSGENCGTQKVAALVGGFHLHSRTDNEVREFAEKLKNCEVPYVCTGHCTGERAYGILKEELGEKLHHLKTGLVIEL